MAALYSALENDTIKRAWKKKAISLMVDIDQAQRKLQQDIEIPEFDMVKLIRARIF